MKEVGRRWEGDRGRGIEVRGRWGLIIFQFILQIHHERRGDTSVGCEKTM